MSLTRIAYFSQRAWRNLRQNPFLGLATVAVVAVALAVIGIYLLLVANLQDLTRHWSREIQAVVYLPQAPSDELLRQWQQSLQQLPPVQTVRYVSPAEAYRRFQQRLGTDADLLTGVPAEVLPASLEISLREAYRHRAGLAELTTLLRQNPSFTEIDAGQEWLDRFESLLVVLRLAALVLGSFLVFSALVIIANTIRLTLYARRAEIEIQELVGATPLVIKGPFLLEGIVQGILGGLCALLLCRLAFDSAVQHGLSPLMQNFGVTRLHFLSTLEQATMILGGGLLGLLGSLLASLRLVRE